LPRNAALNRRHNLSLPQMSIVPAARNRQLLQGGRLGCRLNTRQEEDSRMVSFLRRCSIFPYVIAIFVGGSILVAQENRVVLERGGSTIVLEPYAPNILRVTLSLNRGPALAAPGYGVLAAPAAAGWSASQTAQADVYQSARIVATVEPAAEPDGTTAIASSPARLRRAHHLYTPEGKKLLEMTGWTQAVPNQKDGTADVLRDRRPTDAEFYTVGATFASPDDEHYYGLGQNQEGFLDHRGHAVRCWADYLAPAAPSFCVPFW
jgi:alpha-D-xyloside xylohydrolase